MKKELIVFENRYQAHHRVVLISFAVISFFFVYNSINKTGDLTGPIVTVIFTFLTIYLSFLAFAKKGLLNKEDKLYKTISIGKIMLFRTSVNLQNRKVVSILSSRKRLRFSFISTGNESQGDSFSVNELFLLNDNHTERDPIIYFEQKENVGRAIDFLTKNFQLRHEEFQPNFN